MYTNLPYQFYWLYYIATITDFTNSYLILFKTGIHGIGKCDSHNSYWGWAIFSSLAQSLSVATLTRLTNITWRLLCIHLFCNKFVL